MIRNLIFSLIFITNCNYAHADKYNVNFSEYYVYDSHDKSIESKKNGLDLSRTEIQDEDLKQLKETQYINITWLSLRSTAISDDSLTYLKHLKLKTLILEDTDITGSGLEYLKKMPLKILSLENTKVDDEGLENIKNLELIDLNLTGTKISDQGIFLLKDMPLHVLNLYSTSISDLGLENLLSLGLPLKKLFLTGTQTTEAKVNWLRDKLPGTIIIY